ncbi:acetylornithine aminotransferase/acetylornithine/N-succinyldiaminopimelate aminotransferase [Desulfitispora alkaliphila]|uniref:aspartate aminotransferase family protein n=1 Tax=Desulfitispora alkaliphila TaxID=622674 RepID=UPI003D1C9B09
MSANSQQIMDKGKKYVMNTYGRLPMAIVKGQGSILWDAEGNQYLDFVGGLAVTSLGHCPEQVTAAIKEQSEKLLHCSNLYWIEPQVDLAQLLVENSCMNKVFFANSGAEANEGAIKLARKYAKEHFDPEKYEIITLDKSFHGRTLATLTATGQEKFHQGFEPLPVGFKYAPLNDLQALESLISDKTCAVMLEPIQGEGGVNVATKEYLTGVKKLCQQHDALLIFDEVQVGLGRTGTMFAYEHFDVEPDIMTLAKALAGGVPMSALLAKDPVAAAFKPGDHATTFGGNPLAAAAGIAAVNALLEDGVLENGAKVGEYMEAKLKQLAADFSIIEEVRGKGMIWGIQLSCSGQEIVTACQEKGLLINCAAGNVLRLLPALNISKSVVDEAVNIMYQVLLEKFN